MLDSASIGMIIALIILIAMSAYFSATETAFTSLNRIRLKNKADNGSRRAVKALELSEEYDKLLSTILIGNNIVNNVATTIGAVLFIKLLNEESGPAVSAAVLTIVILIFGEVTPKSLAKENPEGFALAVDLAKREGADFIVGSDPDADRVGIMVRTKSGEFQVISGNQTGDSHKGMGIGLTLCKTIINAHGGHIEASNYEKGALFTFTLPDWREY